VSGPPGPPPRLVDRAELLGHELPPSLIAECETVLWVHGMLEDLPAPLPVCVDIRHRYVAEVPRTLVLREVVIDDDQIETVRGLHLTRPARTVLDLLRRAEEPDWAVLRAFVVARAVRAEDVRIQIDRRGRLPHKRRAEARIGELLAVQPAVTRYTS
jgi:hypothetical protein